MRNQSKKKSIALGCLAALFLGILLINQAAAKSVHFAWEDEALPVAVLPTSPPPTPTPYCPDSYLELVVDKPLVEVGELFTLTIIYHNLGQPWVYGVGLTPEGLAVLDPPIDEWPCKLCSVFPLRATAVGRLEIRSGATGEIYCNGWMWSGASSKEPAVVQVVQEIWRYHLPVLGR